LGAWFQLLFPHICSLSGFCLFSVHATVAFVGDR